MATTHFARTAYKGRCGDGMAGQRVDYITRQGAYAPAEARVQHQGFQTGTAQEREDLVYWRARNLPSWAEESATVFFTAAEQHTSPHQIAYEEWKVSLPRELTRAQQMAAARDFLASTFGATHPYVWAFHDPGAADGGGQPHMHVLWSARTLDGMDRSPAQFFTRYNRKHPERGGAEKDRTFSHFGAVKAARVQYTDIMNLHLERAGQTARLHPDTLLMRGFDREPEPRLRIKDSNALKHKNAITERMQTVLEHRRQHTPGRAQEQDQARTYWEERKASLGITQTLPRETQLERISEARAHVVTQAPPRLSPPQLRTDVHALEQSLTKTERYLIDVQDAQALERRHTQSGRRDVATEWRIEQVLADGVHHGFPRDPEAEKAVHVAATFTQRSADGQGKENTGKARSMRQQPTHEQDRAAAAPAQTLTQQLRRLAQRLAHPDTPQHGGQLRVRLFDEEDRAREQGRGW